MSQVANKSFRLPVETDELAQKEIELQNELEKLQKQKIQKANSLKAEEASRKKELEVQIEKLIKHAEHCDNLSLRAFSPEDKSFYAREAANSRTEAEEIGVVLNVDKKQDIVEVEGKAGILERMLSHAGTLYAALFIFALVAFVSHKMVFKIGEEINAINMAASKAQDLSQMVPPSIGQMTFQKGWYTWMTISFDLIALIVIMALIAPDKLFFLLPFTKNSQKAWKAFSNQPETQKQWQSYAYVALILLFLAISHLGGK